MITNNFLYLNIFCTFLFSFIYALFIILLIIAIAFFTILERKVLASVQRRRGPNMVGFWGLLQALADGFKLLVKEPIFVSGSNYYIFLCAPIFLFAISLTMWVLVPIPGFYFGVNLNYSFIVVFFFSALNSFAVTLAGLASNSRYSLIGGVRAIAQLISYEIPLSISSLTILCLQSSLNMYDTYASKFFFLLILGPSVIIFSISLLAETNRTPFDLPEAEAELVAGYNLEYSSILFSLFFLAEYSNIIFASSLISLLLFNGLWFYISIIFFCLFAIFIRSILPRYTFAQLIRLCWTTLIPASITLLLFSMAWMFFFNLYFDSFSNSSILSLSDLAVDDSNLLVKVNYSNKWSFFPFLFLVKVYPFFANASSVYISPTSKLDLSIVQHNVNLLIFFVVSLFIVILLVTLNWICVNFNANNKKNSPYECGFEPLGSPVAEFGPNFIAVAIMFLIYDVEVLLIFPWVSSFSGKTFICFIFFFIYLIIMLLGLIYEVMDDAFHNI